MRCRAGRRSQLCRDYTTVVDPVSKKCDTKENDRRPCHDFEDAIRCHHFRQIKVGNNRVVKMLIVVARIYSADCDAQSLTKPDLNTTVVGVKILDGSRVRSHADRQRFRVGALYINSWIAQVSEQLRNKHERFWSYSTSSLLKVVQPRAVPC